MVRMRLQHGGACANHFSAFAARVARGRHLSQTTMRLWQRWQVRKSPLTSRLSGAIHIDHHVLLIAAIPDATWTGKRRCALKEIVETVPAECLHGWLIQGSEEARKSRARREAVTPKECRHVVLKRSQAIIQGLEGPFSTERIAQQHKHEINGVIGSKASTSTLHLLVQSRKNPHLREDVSEHGNFLHP